MTIEELVDKSGMIKFVYKVTPEVYYSFQRCSNDYNPLHTDKMYAEEKGFTGKVMYGRVHYISKTFVYFRNIA
jgi:acyl dehydratase